MWYPSLKKTASAIPGEGTPGKEENVVKDPVKVLNFPLLDGGTWQ